MVVVVDEEPPNFSCNDCGIDVLAIGDWYMAHTEIWEGELGLDWADNLCLACLEKRLGRQLRPMLSDIYPAQTWFRGQPPLSARLDALWRTPPRPKRKKQKRR